MPKIETIYLVHHSHTDIGYTHDQPIVWELQTRFIDEALDLAERYADLDSDGAFRWTVETTSVLKRWLARASTRDIERLQALEKAGRVEVTGMFANLTPLLDTDQFLETFQFLRTLRNDYGFTIEHAMNCDVNGENWPLVDLLLDLGIKGFTMAINTHFGGAVQPRPLPFLWEGPSGRTIPVNNGWPYDKGWREGIGRDADDLENVRLPRLQQYLDDISYPLPILLLQSYHPYGDNGSAFDFTPFIEEWNAAGKSPRIVMATPRMWWNAVAEHTDSIPTLKGDWTDYWNFGSISSAREQTMNRESRTRLRNADAIYASLKSIADDMRWSPLSFERYRESAWENLILWDEHTWGADIAIRVPYSEDTATQWHHKANYAYNARSLSLMLQRDAIADLAQRIQRNSNDDILVFNPLPYDQTITGGLPYYVQHPRGTTVDTTAGRHHQDRWSMIHTAFSVPDYSQLTLPPTEISAYGYRVIARDDLQEIKSSVSEAGTIENHRYRIVFDRETGGITSLYDKELDWELVDSHYDYPMNGYVYERVADEAADWARHRLFHQEWNADRAEIPPGWKRDWHAKRAGSRNVIKHEVLQNDIGITVKQVLEGEGTDGYITQIVHLPHYADYVEVEAYWKMTLDDHPEATYIAFPFNLDNATARYDVGFQSVVAGDEQLPGVCRDYFTVQGWVDFSNGEHGVTIATPDNPLVQLGDFHFGDFQREFNLERALLLGWVTNNYWETNFRAHQPGQVSARYRIMPYAGGFDEARAHRFGQEAMHKQPLFQQLGEVPVDDAPLPQAGSLLNLPEMPIAVLHVKAAEAGEGLIVRLLNTSDSVQQATIHSALLKIVGANHCDLLENVGETIDIVDGRLTVNLEPRQITVLHLQTQLA